MNRTNLFWGIGGVLVGTLMTYFVMEYIYDKEMAELFSSAPEDEEVASANLKKVIDITDAEMYKPTKDINAEDFHHVVSQEEHMEEDEALVMGAIWMDENGGDDLPNDVTEELPETEEVSEENEEPEKEDPEQEDEEVRTTNVYDQMIHVIEVAEVNPGRRIVARFNHDDCSLDISTEMSVKTEELDERINEPDLEGLLGLEAYNILMNSEPSKQVKMIGVRNNIINLDFAISF